MDTRHARHKSAAAAAAHVLRDEAGASAIEYGLLAALIAVVSLGALSGLGEQLSTTFSTVSSQIANATPAAGDPFADWDW